MFPGGGNPRQMKRMMKQMGIDMEQLDASEVVIRLDDGSELVFSGPQVSAMDAQGQKIYQVVGEPEEKSAEYVPSEEDVELVLEQADATEEKAREALEESGGDIADAIMKLS